jgi:hypothetical protein
MRQQATQEGLVPLKAWVKNAFDHVIRECMNEPGLEFVWVGDDAVDPLEQAQTLQILVGAGIKTREEARADLGLAPAGGKGPRKASQTLLRLQTPHPVRAQTPPFPRPRTKREHFVDRLRRSWHSHLQWEKWRRRPGPALPCLSEKFVRRTPVHRA